MGDESEDIIGKDGWSTQEVSLHPKGSNDAPLKLAAVIAAHNPPEQFVSLVGQLAVFGFDRIIVVNHGSDRDGTGFPRLLNGLKRRPLSGMR